MGVYVASGSNGRQVDITMLKFLHLISYGLCLRNSKTEQLTQIFRGSEKQK